MGIFTNTFNKIKGIVTGGSDSTKEKKSTLDYVRGKKEISQSEINFLRNNTTMMLKRKATRRMRRKMRRATQQSQRGD